MSIFRRVGFTINRIKASKLNNSGKYEEALAVLDKLSGPPDEMSKLALYRADILFRKKDYGESLDQYNLFLESYLANIEPDQDQNYLRLYALFYIQQLRKRLGKEPESIVDRQEVKQASARATALTRAEFNF